MSEFIASNGVVIELRQRANGLDEVSVSSCGLTVEVVGYPRVQALREFFRAEEDKRLGRWRDPERDSFVVYPQMSAGIIVLCETTGTSRLFADRNDVDSFRSSYLSPSAYAYFDAHPEPKPAWHDAKPGEVWVLDVVDIGEGAYVAGDFTFSAADHGIPLDCEKITAGRRIYPEDTE